MVKGGAWEEVATEEESYHYQFQLRLALLQRAFEEGRPLEVHDAEGTDGGASIMEAFYFVESILTLLGIPIEGEGIIKVV